MKLFLYLLININLVQCEAALRILGSRNAFKDEFPYSIRLELHMAIAENEAKYVYGAQLCTGAALSSTWILTAAHCYDQNIYEHSNLKVFARYNSYFPEHFGEISLIVEFIIHPGFTGHESTMINDLGLCRCERISVSKYAKISAVGYRHLIGHEALVLGFGGTNASDLQKPLQVLEGMLNYCNEFKHITQRMTCLVPRCKLVATICGGDSGGPVIHPSGVIGVNSMSIDNCDERTKFLERTAGTASSIIALVGSRLNWLSNVIRNKTELSEI